MEEINLWEELSDKYLILNNIDDVIKNIKENKLSMDFSLKDIFIPGQEITDIHDNIASKKKLYY